MDILQTLGINPQVILANILAFLLLLLILSKLLIKPISEVMRDRKEEIEGSFHRIAEENRKIEETQASLARRLEEIEIEARQKIQEAAAQASRMKDELLAEARAAAELVKERGVQEIELEREKALQVIRQQVADLVVQAGEKVLAQSISDTKHRDLIAKAIAEIEARKN